MYKLTKKLVQKSNEAFLISLEVFNKPTFNFRTESFSLLYTNAWELLLKAHIYQENKGKKLSIFRKKKRNAKRESINIDECLNKVFLDNLDPVRRNIEFISEIRNEAAHLIIQELDPYFSRAFQAGITNYVKFLYDWFKVDINKRLNPGLLSLISDKDKIPELTILKSKYNKEDFNTIVGWVEKFKELEKLGQQATLSIRHTIAIVKNPKRADMVISSGSVGEKTAVVLEKTKEPDVTHPFNRSSAILEIKKRLPKTSKFNEHNFESYAYVKKYKKSNNDYFYKGKYSGAGQYSQKFIDELVQAINKNPKNLQNWRTQYAQYLSTRRRKTNLTS